MPVETSTGLPERATISISGMCTSSKDAILIASAPRSVRNLIELASKALLMQASPRLRASLKIGWCQSQGVCASS